MCIEIVRNMLFVAVSFSLLSILIWSTNKNTFNTTYSYCSVASNNVVLNSHLGTKVGQISGINKHFLAVETNDYES